MARLLDTMKTWMRVPVLTWPRMIIALAVALAADGGQLALLQLGWLGLDQAIDCVAALVIGRTIGFHPLLLPTFMLELVPVLEDLPTWTACTLAVIALRRRGPPGRGPSSPPPEKPVIDI